MLLRGGMTVVHDATINDQRLDLYSLELHWWQIIALLPAMRRGRHTSGGCPPSEIEVGFVPSILMVKSQLHTCPIPRYPLAPFWFLVDTHVSFSSHAFEIFQDIKLLLERLASQPLSLADIMAETENGVLR